MNISIFISLLFVFQIFYWIIGRYASKNLKCKTDYFLSGKTVRFFPLMMTFLATQVGGGIVLGAADEAYQLGWPVLLYPFGTALGLILLGAGIGRRLAELQISTVAQIFEVAYRSLILRRIASILSIVSLFMILVAQITASNKFLSSLGFNNILLFIVFWAIIIAYTAQGGLKAVISTDMIQASFFSIMLLTCFSFVYFSDPSIPLLQLPQLEDFTQASSKLCGWLLMPLLFMIIEQDMGQRCFAGASPRTVSRAALLAGIGTLVICIVPIFFGSLAKTIGLEVPKGSSALMAIIAKTTTPWITALLGCAVLAAIISTATSLINAISSNLSSDFKIPFLQNMRMVRWVACAISVTAIFFALCFNSIVDLLIQSYELSVSCLFVPIFIALFKKQGTFLAALMAMLFGGLGFFLFRIHSIGLPKEIASILLSLIGFSCGEIISYYTKTARETTYEK